MCFVCWNAWHYVELQELSNTSSHELLEMHDVGIVCTVVCDICWPSVACIFFFWTTIALHRTALHCIEIHFMVPICTNMHFLVSSLKFRNLAIVFFTYNTFVMENPQMVELQQAVVKICKTDIIQKDHLNWTDMWNHKLQRRPRVEKRFQNFLL